MALYFTPYVGGLFSHSLTPAVARVKLLMSQRTDITIPESWQGCKLFLIFFEEESVWQNWAGGGPSFWAAHFWRSVKHKKDFFSSYLSSLLKSFMFIARRISLPQVENQSHKLVFKIQNYFLSHCLLYYISYLVLFQKSDKIW